jgi:hypothetical protein
VYNGRYKFRVKWRGVGRDVGDKVLVHLPLRGELLRGELLRGELLRGAQLRGRRRGPLRSWLRAFGRCRRAGRRRALASRRAKPRKGFAKGIAL